MVAMRDETKKQSVEGLTKLFKISSADGELCCLDEKHSNLSVFYVFCHKTPVSLLPKFDWSAFEISCIQ